MGEIGGEGLMQFEKAQDVNASEERVVVSVRLRPLNAKEIARNDVSDWECINDNTIIHRSSLPERSMYPNAYTFDRVFPCECPTKRVYEEAAKEVALSVIGGINSSIFAYGQTSSGKTYTMSGITECTVSDIYDYIQRHKERTFVLKFSAMEIYNEAVRDLLSADGTPLRLLDDPERGTVVDRLTEETLRDQSHLQELLSVCETQRQIGETSLNEASSRSHQILRLTIESSAREFLGKDNSSTLAASVDFVDLAGSERASQALSAGTRLKEGCHINRSLLTLGTVIRKLSKGRNGHIPYRDSKLTRILQSSLGGNARTAIICTINPARSHVEQSRNTLSFASCAKEVATNAQVNIVMSDKALVKHLQRELARLEGELRGPGPTPVTYDPMELLREKDLQIEKMEKEIKELTQQRDFAQSRLEDLVQVIGDGRASGPWVEFDPPPKAFEDEYTISESESLALADNHCQDVGVTRFNMSLYSNGSSECSSNDHCLRHTESPEDHHQSLTPRIWGQHSEKPEQLLSKNASLPFSVSGPKFVGSHPYQGWEEIKPRTGEDVEELCKEVRCIEMEESSTNKIVVSNALSLEENEGVLPLIVSGNVDETDEDLVSSPQEGNKELSHVHTTFTYDALEKKLQDVKKTIDCLVNSSPDELSPWLPTADLSNSRSLLLTRSRSCRATLMTSSSPRLQKAEQNENTPQNGFEKYFPGRPEGFPRRFHPLNYNANSPNLSRENSLTSERSSSIEELKAHDMKTPSEEDITSIRAFVTGMKDMAKLQCEKQLAEDQVQERETKAAESGKTVKDVGLDPMQDPLESPSSWSLEFKKQQREIIELWHTCNVSLVHRTYFFLLFKGDPTDSIYMEVELRRLHFLKDTFSQGNLAKLTVEGSQDLTPASSMKALRREREMLSKQMQKRFSEEEREKLYQKWGIGLGTKQRRLQLAHRLWANIKDMNHIVESASLVAKLVGLLEPGQALKEMFGLSFTPRRISRRSNSWRNSMSSLL